MEPCVAESRDLQAEPDTGLVRQAAVEQAIQAPIDVLRTRKGTSFLLVWCLHGMDDVQVAASSGYDGEGLRDELVSFLTEFMNDYIP
jgi:hypothetical protein